MLCKCDYLPLYWQLTNHLTVVYTRKSDDTADLCVDLQTHLHLLIVCLFELGMGLAGLCWVFFL